MKVKTHEEMAIELLEEHLKTRPRDGSVEYALGFLKKSDTALREIRALRRWAKKKATVPFGQDGMSSKQVFEFDLLEWAKTRERKLKGGKL